MKRRVGPVAPRTAGSAAASAPSTVMLWVLLAANVAVWLVWQQALPDAALRAAFRTNLTVGLDGVAAHPWTLLTAGFSHVASGHLLANALGLWVFGQDVCARVGQRAFLGLYVAGAVIASCGHLVWQAVSGAEAPALGASGAVMAIGAVYGCLFPKRILLVGLIVPMPAWLAVVAWAALDVAGLFGGGDGIAHAAHLGGAAFGLLYWALRLRGR